MKMYSRLLTYLLQWWTALWPAALEMYFYCGGDAMLKFKKILFLSLCLLSLKEESLKIRASCEKNQNFTIIFADFKLGLFAGVREIWS
ncbi:unnamed protein product [Gulo gulo]|uniref:Uncharacterized protein n=1 Tax=Gulo gulo TaxID=48420 RepID=A0A9X9M317_GULGU|nr:unnamed protein product [Gulo gulo]